MHVRLLVSVCVLYGVGEQIVPLTRSGMFLKQHVPSDERAKVIYGVFVIFALFTNIQADLLLRETGTSLRQDSPREQIGFIPSFSLFRLVTLSLLVFYVVFSPFSKLQNL